MKFFRKLALAALLTALLTGTCLARETFHGAYLQGFPDGSIRPDAAVTRAELAEILYRMMEPEQRRELTCTESAFQDVSARHWAYDAICAMAGARLMLGGSESIGAAIASLPYGQTKLSGFNGLTCALYFAALIVLSKYCLMDRNKKLIYGCVLLALGTLSVILA